MNYKILIIFILIISISGCVSNSDVKSEINISDHKEIKDVTYVDADKIISNRTDSNFPYKYHDDFYAFKTTYDGIKYVCFYTIDGHGNPSGISCIRR